MMTKKELVVKYIFENGIFDGLSELEERKEVVPTDVGGAYEQLTLLEVYDCIETVVGMLKKEVEGN